MKSAIVGGAGGLGGAGHGGVGRGCTSKKM